MAYTILEFSPKTSETPSFLDNSGTTRSCNRTNSLEQPTPTFQELCRLQTFPEGLTLDCGRTEMQRMLGNAVPSLVAEVLAREIRGQLLDVPMSEPLHLPLKRQKHLPPPVKEKPIPRNYLAYVGKHAPHPGTGKGRVASQRKETRTELIAVD